MNLKPEGMNPVVVAFTGAVYSGKTTTIELTSKLLMSWGHKVVTCNEAAKEILEEYARKLYGSSNLSEVLDDMRKSPIYLKFQKDVIEKQHNFERLTYREALRQGADVVLIDRTILDWLWFFMLYCGKYSKSEEFVECLSYYNMCVCPNTHYDIVFLCDYSDIIDDYGNTSYRSIDDTTFISRLAQHNFIEAMLKISKFDYITLRGRPIERAEFAVKKIDKLVQERAVEAKIKERDSDE